MRDLKIIIKKKILEELSEITDIVITKADKGRKIVIRKKKYIQEAERQGTS